MSAIAHIECQRWKCMLALSKNHVDVLPLLSLSLSLPQLLIFLLNIPPWKIDMYVPMDIPSSITTYMPCSICMNAYKSYEFFFCICVMLLLLLLFSCHVGMLLFSYLFHFNISIRCDFGFNGILFRYNLLGNTYKHFFRACSLVIFVLHRFSPFTDFSYISSM